MNNNVDGTAGEIHSAVVEVLGGALLDLAWSGDEGALADWRQRCAGFGSIAPEPLARLPWLLTHEFLCHVYQEPAEPAVSAEPVWGCRSDCPFFEGWMDEVAFGLFSVYVAPGWRERPEIAQAADDLRKERYLGAQPGERGLITRQWALGREAAGVLMRFFEGCAAYDREETRRRAALAQLTGLSFRIQTATSSRPGLRRIVNSCLLAGQCSLSFMRASERGELLRLLTQPIVDINEWITRLESLWRHFPI